MAQQGPPRSRPDRPSTPRGNRQRWSEGSYPDDDEEYPPWAGPGIEPRWAGGRERRPRSQSPETTTSAPEDAAGTAPAGTDTGRPRGRLAAAKARKTRRLAVRWVLLLVVVGVIGGGTWWLTSGTGGPAAQPNPLVTNFLPGEFQTVPDVCTTVTPATLSSYLPGKRVRAAPQSLNGGAGSLCSWTLDARPLYRLLNVQAQAYAPNGLASGDGSATFAGIDAYNQAKQQKTRPAKGTHLPKATITPVKDIGTTAFAALQITKSGGVTTDLMTVVVRDHNVVVTSVLEGDSGRGYGHVSPAQLTAGATAAARDVLSGLN